MSVCDPFAVSRHSGRGSRDHTFAADLLILCVEAQLCVVATHFALVRNFLHLASIPWLHGTSVWARPKQEGHPVIEVERDGRVGIDLKFGSITFKEDDNGSFAVALVDVLVGGPAEAGTRVQMEVRVAADPEKDSILGVTEKCRAQIVSTLRAAADTFDRMNARTLLYHEVGKVAAE